MVRALGYLWEIYRQFMIFIFNDFVIFEGEGHSVKFGWFIIALFVFGVVLRNILALPKSAPRFNSERGNNHE